MTSFRWEDSRVHALSGITYNVRTEETILTGNDGRPEASMFSYSYIAETGKTDRPVAFCYNGGPGADSGWLHMGLLGPKTISFDQYPDGETPDACEMNENPEFLIDTCDIVMIDPVGTSYARLIDPEASHKYYSTGGDGQAFADFIVKWLENNEREGSDVYLIGESYGTLRNLAIADVLPGSVNLKGIVSIGTSFNVGARTTLLVEPNVRRLGANAYGCWYHYHRNEITAEQFVEEAMNFAYTDYAHALLMGSRLNGEEKEHVLDRLAYFTGLDRELLKAQNLRFSEMDYMTGLIPSRILSMYDSRLTGPYEPASVDSINPAIGESSDPAQEPFMNIVGKKITEALRSYQAEIGLPDDIEYQTENHYSIAMQWDFLGYEKDTIILPVELMQRNKNLKFMFINGRYDLSSTFDFVTYYLSRYDLPSDRIETMVYEGGHATYIGGKAAEQLSRDIRQFIRHA